MKKLIKISHWYFITEILLVAILVNLNNCSGEPEKMTLTAPEGFAYALDEGWEFNGSVQVDGFTQIEDSLENFLSSVSYSADLLTPENDTLRKVDFGVAADTAREEILDMQINFQIEFNSGFSKGEYKLIIFASDENSSKKDTTYLKFQLSDF